MNGDTIACTRAEITLSLDRLLRFLRIPEALRRSRVDLVLAVVILAIGIGIRFATIVTYDSPARHEYSDMGGYILGARQIASGSFQKWHFFQGVGYPLLLAAVGVGRGVWIWIALLHFVASALTLVLAWRCAAMLVGERGALFAAAVMGLDASLVGIASFAMPETVYALTVTAALWFWLKYDQRERSVWIWGLGVAIALGSILKGTIVILLPALLAYGLLVSRRKLRGGLAFAAGLGVILLPLSLFVHQHYGTYKISADNAGFSFMDGKCPWKHNMNTEGADWLSPLNVQLGDTQTHTWTVPFDHSGYYFAAGLRCIKDDPVEIARSLRYVYYLFFDNEIWPVTDGPVATQSRVTTMFWRVVIVPGLLFGALALAFTRKRQHWIWLAFVIAPCLVAYIFKAEARYRLPFDAVFVAVATFGWKTVLSGLTLGGDEAAAEGSSVKAFRRWMPRGRRD